MSTYKEREAKRRAKETHPIRDVLLFLAGCNIAALLAAAIMLPLWPSRYEAGEIAWGEESRGLQAGIEIASVDDEGDDISYRFHLKNVGSEPVLVDKRSALYDGLEVLEQGAPVQMTGRTSYGDTLWLVSIEPDDTFTEEREVTLRMWDVPGRYDVEIAWVYANDRPVYVRKYWVSREQRTEVTEDVLHVKRLRREERTEVTEGIWTGEARSGTVRVVGGKPWYAFIIQNTLFFVLLYGLVKGWGRLRRFVARKKDEPEPEEESTAP